jgi:two-component system, chemotaxis family, chemotaxis protein CheY
MTENPKILIVDDFETVRLFLRNALNQIGLENIEEAGDGKEALQVIEDFRKRSENFDIVFCDWNMPEMTGIELLNHVRRTAHLKDLPFVMVTAESETVSIETALKSGATDYITKPFTVDGLRDKIESILKRLQSAKAS